MNLQTKNTFGNMFDDLLALRQHMKNNPDDLYGKFVGYCAANCMHSCSQLFQDLFVVFFLCGKKDGFFVEFGATNGVELSNTVILERNFRWKGILAEPAKRWHSSLRNNRRALIDTRCVWSESGKALEFKETPEAEYSTLSTLVDRDLNRERRTAGSTYTVETISLTDLLKIHNCPEEIDYLSIDTEGSEAQILNAFEFQSYDIKIITVEHNYCEQDRKSIFQLLSAKGFVRIFETLSKFDDWYIKRSIVGL